MFNVRRIWSKLKYHRDNNSAASEEILMTWENAYDLGKKST